MLAGRGLGACREQGSREVGHSGLRATSALQQEESHLLEQCWDLDRAVVQLTKFVHQNQMSLNHVLLAEQKTRWVSEWSHGPGNGAVRPDGPEWSLSPDPGHPEPSTLPSGVPQGRVATSVQPGEIAW